LISRNTCFGGGQHGIVFAHHFAVQRKKRSAKLIRRVQDPPAAEVADMALRDPQTLCESDLCDPRGHEVSDKPLPCSFFRHDGILPQRLHGSQAIDDPDVEKDRTPFARRMRQARVDAGLTQVVAAQKAGISQSTLAEIETDAHSSKYTPVLAALYRADPHYLATGKAARGAPSHWALRVAALIDEFPAHLREQATWRCQGALDAMHRSLEAQQSLEPNPERFDNRA
jgi:DNA-binding XRE family transcriptional regulator